MKLPPPICNTKRPNRHIKEGASAYLINEDEVRRVADPTLRKSLWSFSQIVCSENVEECVKYCVVSGDPPRTSRTCAEHSPTLLSVSDLQWFKDALLELGTYDYARVVWLGQLGNETATAVVNWIEAAYHYSRCQQYVDKDCLPFSCQGFINAVALAPWPQ